MEIKCSVLIPLYNQQDLIKKCINSIPKRADIEIIVVDDKSIDNSLEILGEYSTITIIKNEINLGIGITRQKLLDAATGDYIFFLDSDDFVYTDVFEKVLDSLDGKYDVVETMRRMNNGYTYHSKVWQGAFIKTSIAKSVKFKDVRCHEDTYWKKEILETYPNLKMILLQHEILYHYNYPRAGSLTYIDKHPLEQSTQSISSYSENIHMKYIIMCGGKYTEFDLPRQLIQINNEEIVARTIRLLHQNNIKDEDIWITSNNPVFDKFGLTRKVNETNNYESTGHNPNGVVGWWMDALYPMDEPCCYLFGDVFYSPEAIKIIVETLCQDNLLFGVIPTKNTLKKWKEPLALKVVNQEKLKKAISELKEMWLKHDKRLVRHPLIWEVFSQMNNLPFFPNSGNTNSKCFIGISDYSTDVDHPEDAQLIEYFLEHGSQLEESSSKINNNLNDDTDSRDVSMFRGWRW